MKNAVTTPVLPPPPAAVDLQALVDALLYSVSHDLRSPLLTLSLSADLLDEAIGEQVRGPGHPSGAAVALDALRQGARDLERMLQALTQVSRARRRVLGGRRARLRMLLGGHVVLSDEGDLGNCAVAIDPLPVRELFDALSGEDPLEIRVSRIDDYIILDVAVPLLPPLEQSPLSVLAGSLHAHAGGIVERLAVAQVLLERQGGALAGIEQGIRLWLPEGMEA